MLTCDVPKAKIWYIEVDALIQYSNDVYNINTSEWMHQTVVEGAFPGSFPQPQQDP